MITNDCFPPKALKCPEPEAFCNVIFLDPEQQRSTSTQDFGDKAIHIACQGALPWGDRGDPPKPLITVGSG